jgi:hypothetical protein
MLVHAWVCLSTRPAGCTSAGLMLRGSLVRQFAPVTGCWA